MFNPYPDIQVSHELLELMRAWHVQFPGTDMNWQPVELPDSLWYINRETKPGTEQALAMYYRFSGPPLHEKPEAPTFLWAAAGSLRGVPVAGMFIDLATAVGGYTGQRRGISRYTLTSSIDTPARKPRLVLCRRAGHVHHSPTGDPRFDEAFAVHADEQGFADAVLTPQFIEWYVTDPRSPHLPLIFENGTLSTGFGKPPKKKTEEYEEVHTLSHAPMADFLLQALSRISPAAWY